MLELLVAHVDPTDNPTPLILDDLNHFLVLDVLGARPLERRKCLSKLGILEVMLVVRKCNQC